MKEWLHCVRVLKCVFVCQFHSSTGHNSTHVHVTHDWNHLLAYCYRLQQ